MIASKKANKVITRQQVKEIWLADDRLTSLTEQWLKAMYEEEDELAERLKNKCDKLKQEMRVKYDILL